MGKDFAEVEAAGCTIDGNDDSFAIELAQHLAAGATRIARFSLEANDGNSANYGQIGLVAVISGGIS